MSKWVRNKSSQKYTFWDTKRCLVSPYIFLDNAFTCHSIKEWILSTDSFTSLPIPPDPLVLSYQQLLHRKNGNTVIPCFTLLGETLLIQINLSNSPFNFSHENNAVDFTTKLKKNVNRKNLSHWVLTLVHWREGETLNLFISFFICPADQNILIKDVSIYIIYYQIQ
jgi:hypothetical protein